MKNSREEVIKILQDYFSSKEDVILAFLFGSLAKAHHSVLSDIDIAIYLTNGINEIHIWCELERLLKQEIDLIILNRAGTIIGWEAIRGIPLCIKDRRLYLDIMLDLSREAVDLMERNIDMWMLKEELRCQV